MVSTQPASIWEYIYQGTHWLCFRLGVIAAAHWPQSRSDISTYMNGLAKNPHDCGGSFRQFFLPSNSIFPRAGYADEVAEVPIIAEAGCRFPPPFLEFEGAIKEGLPCFRLNLLKTNFTSIVISPAEKAARQALGRAFRKRNLPPVIFPYPYLVLNRHINPLNSLFLLNMSLYRAPKQPIKARIKCVKTLGVFSQLHL
jgi:hypothetical protein